MARKALVTGGAGFIGSHLCEHLKMEGWTVRALDNFSTGLRENLAGSIETFEGDINDADVCREVCEGVDTVFHLAARVTIRHSVNTFYEDAETNLMGTLNVLRAAGKCGVRRFIFASSMGVYADSPDSRPVTETHLTEPLSPYGISKLAAEKYTIMMGPRLGLEPVVLRLFNTFGTRQGYTPYVGVATIFITQILEDKTCTIFGDGMQCRDFIHVSDLVNAIILAADAQSAAGEIINVGTGVATSVNQLAEMIRDLLGKGHFVRSPAHAVELRHCVANISKAGKLLGYKPTMGLQDRLPGVLDYVRGRLKR